MNVKRWFQSVFKNSKQKKRKKKNSLKLLSGQRGKSMSSKKKGRSYLFTYLAAFLVSLIIIYGIYQFILVGMYRYAQLENVRFSPIRESESQDAPTEKWNGREKLTMLYAVTESKDAGRKEIVSLAVVQVYPDKQEVVWIFLPPEVYTKNGSLTDTKLKNLIIAGEVRQPNSGYFLALDTLEESLYIRFDRYMFIDSVFFEEYFDIIGGVRLYVNESSLYQGDGTSIKVDAFGEETYTWLTSDSVDDFLDSDASVVSEKSMQKQIFLVQGSFNGIGLFDIWALDRVSESIEQNFQSNFSSEEFISFLKFTRSNNEESAYVAMLPTSLEEDISSTGDSIHVLGGRKVEDYLSENLLNSEVKEELARVEIFNGTDENGLALRVSRYFGVVGIDVIRRNNASQSYEKSAIYVQDDGRNYTFTIKEIKKIVGSDVEVIFGHTEFLSTGDIVVVLGNDLIQEK